MDVYSEFKNTIRKKIRDGYEFSKETTSLESYLTGVERGIHIILGYSDKDNMNYETMNSVKRVILDVTQELRKDYNYESGSDISSK